MIHAYNVGWLRNLAVIKETRRWVAAGLISREKYTEIVSAFPSLFYHPNLIIRILLFIATVIAYSGVTGLIFLIFADLFDSSETGIFSLTLISGVLTLAVLDQFFIRRLRQYKSGVTEAVLYSSITMIVVGIAGLGDMEVLAISLLCFLVCAFSALRYLDLISTAVAFGALCFLIYRALDETGGLLFQLMPFVFMIIFAGVYFLTKRIARLKTADDWHDVLVVCEVIALAVFYAAGNYFVVRSMSESLMGLSLLEGEDIPFAMVFYILTALIPAVYLYFGIMRKDIVLLRVSLAALAFSVFTFKYYFSLGHHEITFTAGGAVLIAVSLAIFRYLRRSRNGYTRESILTEKWASANPEAFIISQTMGNRPQAPVEEYGKGGGFGGGGASGGY